MAGAVLLRDARRVTRMFPGDQELHGQYRNGNGEHFMHDPFMSSDMTEDSVASL